MNNTEEWRNGYLAFRQNQRSRILFLSFSFLLMFLNYYRRRRRRRRRRLSTYVVIVL